MLEFPCGIGFTMDIGNFLQLQRGFHCDCIVQTTSDDEGIFAFCIFLCDFRHSCIYLQHLCCFFGQIMQLLHCRGIGCFCHCAAHLCEIQRNQIQHRHLCGIALCGCNGDFGACPGINHIIAFSGNGAAYHIDNRKHLYALLLCFAQCRKGICGFAALADDDAEVIFRKDRVSVSEFGCDIHLNGDTAGFFNDISADNPCVHGTAAGNNMNSSAVFDFFLCQRNILQMDAAFGHSGLNGLFQRFGLLHDFLHHEIIIAALFCCRDIPCDMINLFLNFLAVYIIQLYAVIFQHGNFICFQ